MLIMTIINGIESLEVKVRTSEVKYALLNNENLEEKLHVIMVVSNPCLYKKRWELAKKFINHMLEFQDDIILYVVELIYGDDAKFNVTSENNKNHLQMRTNTAPMWHKENMINIGVQKLLSICCLRIGKHLRGLMPI